MTARQVLERAKAVAAFLVTVLGALATVVAPEHARIIAGVVVVLTVIAVYRVPNLDAEPDTDTAGKHEAAEL